MTAVAPTRAEAFIGEGVVLNPAKTDLTGPAKTIITNPTFLPEVAAGAETAGGVTEAGAAVATFQGAGVLPVLGGSLLALGAGALIGTEICHVIGISGCWSFTSDSTFTPPAGTPHWYYDSNTATGVSETDWKWAWSCNSGDTPCANDWDYDYPDPKCTDTAAPAGTTELGAATGLLGESACGTPPVSFKRRYAMRSSMANRTLGYNATDNPSISNYEPGGKDYAAPSDWSEKLAKQIGGQEGNAKARVGQKVASKIAGSEVKNPYGTYVNVPDCDGMIYATCADELEEAGLEPAREDLNWSEVETTTPNEVRELEPAKSTEVEKGTAVKVITNPPEEGMPIVIPDPEPGETYSHYAARLNPSLTPERHDLEAAFVDPSAGPNAVVEVSPEPESKLDPSKTHTVQVTTNPADLPVPGAGWSPPGISSIDLEPISGVPSPCTVFPFGLFCWVGEAFAQFNTSGTCPHFSAPVAETGSDFAVTLCGETSETIMGYLRPALLLAFIVGCGFMFAKGTKAVGGD